MTKRRMGDGRPETWNELWQNESFLYQFFFYVQPNDRRILAQVCIKWHDVLYQPIFWQDITPILRCRELRSKPSLRKSFYESMQRRGVDSVCLVDATDDDIHDLINNYPNSSQCQSIKPIRRVAVRSSSVADKGLEILLEHMNRATHLELTGCNEITEAGLWACLNPRFIVLTISDCINVADESINAVAKLLPFLRELNLQAYHVTDSALAYFSEVQAANLRTLRLRSTD